MKKWICAVLALCLPFAAMAESAAVLLRDGFAWGMSADALTELTASRGETAERASENVLTVLDTEFGGTKADLVLSLKDDRLYMIAYDYAQEEPDLWLEAWRTQLTERYGTPGEAEAVETASAMVANANLTGGILDFDELLSGMSDLTTWRPEAHTLIALFLYGEDELCLIAADETVIYDMDENGHIREFGK